MNFLRQHIIFKALTLLLVLTFLLPSAVKVMHVFENHKHEVCYGEVDAHFHTLDIDCEFYKFKLNIPFTIPQNLATLIVYPEIHIFNTKEYDFLSDYQKLHFSRRGPPVINLI
ncbi:hypothetical protein [Gelidibacter maritimus]|uniref:Uncharacterized protein n=1 Tax=Gelidibacter maritimus TaxID=2761487 RepID=A0A7W2M6J8_9FLAO|nr:hypothetical protein [Gelidibacter maritimus]MBA6153605.1 hypothetical protein [Gelidibacter maritimus]